MVKPASDGEGVNVQVLLRCRPLDAQERAAGCQSVIAFDKDRPRDVTLQRNGGGKQISTNTTFKFDRVFRPECTQAELYSQAIEPIVKEMLEGFNCTIFAYGQTGTGKTYTMTGGMRDGGEGGDLAPAAGVIPRAIQQIFLQLQKTQGENIVKCSYLELYNEELIDLLAPDLPGKDRPLVHIATDAKDSVVVRGQEEIIVRTAADIFQLLDQGTAKRRTEKTLLNAQSSRSHSVFCVTAHMTERQPDGEDVIKIGKLYLVDLAGSESAAKSGAVGARANEASCINKSLLVLGRVITALVEKSSHIPHRESKLTRLLKDSLGGFTKTCIIATIAPTQPCIDETANTLIYAARAKNIRNRPVVNQVISKAQHIKEITSEIDKLKSELLCCRQKDGVYLKLETYEEMQYNIEDLERQLRAATDEEAALTAQLETTQGQLDAKCAAFDTLSKAFDAKAADLEASKAALAEAREGLQQRDFLLAAHDKAGIRQQAQAHKLRKELGRTACELSTVFDKVNQQSAVEKSNASCVRDISTHVTTGLQELHDSVKGGTAQQVGLLFQLSQLITEHQQRRAADSEAAQTAAAQLRDQLAASVDHVAAATQGLVSNGERQLQAVTGVHARHLEEAATSASAAVDSIAQAHAPLAASLARLDELRESTAQLQQKDAKAAAEMQRLLDDGCRDLSCSGAAVEDTLAALQVDQESQRQNLGIFKAHMAAALATSQEAMAAAMREQCAALQAQTDAAVVAALQQGQLCEAGRDAARGQLQQLVMKGTSSMQSARIAAEEQAATAKEAHIQLNNAHRSALTDSRASGLAIERLASTALNGQLATQQSAHDAMTAAATEGQQALRSTAAESSAACSSGLNAIGDGITAAMEATQSMAKETEAFAEKSGAMCTEVSSHTSGLLESVGCASTAIGTGVTTMIQERHQPGVSTDDLPDRRKILVPSKAYIAELWAPTPAEALAEYKKQQAGGLARQENVENAVVEAASTTFRTPHAKRHISGPLSNATPLRTLETNRQGSGKRRRTEAI